MAMNYRMITIYTAEEVRRHGKPLHEAVADYVQNLKIAARCVVFRAMAGCYETGEIASQNLLTISYNMPVKIEIILPATEAESVLAALEDLVTDGIVAVGDLDVRAYKTRQNLIPRQIKVRDIMTPDPMRVRPETPVSDVVRLLLGPFLPVCRWWTRPGGRWASSPRATWCTGPACRCAWAFWPSRPPAARTAPWTPWPASRPRPS
jgi:PII-like signaling protein